MQKLKIVIPHVMLVVAVVLYALLGAVAFYLIEQPHELELKTNISHQIQDMQVFITNRCIAKADECKSQTLFTNLVCASDWLS